MWLACRFLANGREEHDRETGIDYYGRGVAHGHKTLLLRTECVRDTLKRAKESCRVHIKLFEIVRTPCD